MASRFILPFADVGNGITPEDGALLYFYEEGTSTPKDTFTDEALTIANSNPVVADSTGVFSDIWMSEGARYKVVLEDKNNVQQWEADPIISVVNTVEVLTFDTVAQMVAAVGISLGQDIIVNDYASGNNSGALFFEAVNVGTGTADGGEYIDSTGAPLIQLKQNLPAVLSVKMWGAVGDGITDDTVSIQNAATFAGNSSLYFPSSEYLVSNLVMLEGYHWYGDGQSNLNSGVPDGGTWIRSSTTGNVIDIDGEFTGFDSRRSIMIDGINFFCSTADRVINADFLTRFELSNIMISGASTYGIHMQNSYNGILRRVMMDGQGTGFYSTIKASPDDVFSGQTLFEDCDFWNATADGCKIEASYNVMAQLQFNKCHFKTNATGFNLTGANTHTPVFVSGHFEENSVNDVFVDSTALHSPAFIGCHFNNTNAVKKINCEGADLYVTKCEFIAGDGIRLDGSRARVSENAFRNLTTAITVASNATDTLLGRADYTTVTTNIADNGATTHYEGEIDLISDDIDLAVTSDEYFFQANNDWYIATSELLAQSNTNAGATPSTIDGGIDGTVAKYFSRNGPTQTKGARANITLTSNKIDFGDIVRIGCAAVNSTGTVKCRLRLVPFEI